MNKTEKTKVHETIEKAEVKPYTTKGIAHVLNMSPKTFRRNIRAIKELLGAKKMGYFWSVEQVHMIFDHLGGAPYELVVVVKNNSNDPNKPELKAA